MKSFVTITGLVILRFAGAGIFFLCLLPHQTMNPVMGNEAEIKATMK